VHRRRELATVTFLVLRDRSGLAQVVVRTGTVPPEETTVEVVGIATANAQAPGGVEVTEPTITPLTDDALTPPFELWRPQLTASLPTMLDHAPIAWRHPAQRVKWELAAAALRGFRTTLDGIGFIEDHRDVLAVLREVLAGMLEAAAPIASRADVTLPGVPAEIPVILFAEALELVGAPSDEPDLAPEHERALGAWALEQHGSDFLAVEGYPMRKRPFYTHPWSREGSRHGSLALAGSTTESNVALAGSTTDNSAWSNSFDVLFHGLELVTGGQRLHRYADYVAAITARGESPGAYASYLQAFAHGMPPHGGFAIGLERFVARLVEAPNIREVTLFPRDLNRLSP